MFEKMLEKIANDDYRLAYNLIRTAIARCQAVIVTMNDEMIRKTGIAGEMKIGGLTVIRDDGDCELALSAIGKSGKHILLVFDRKWNAFRCAFNDSPTIDGAQFFKVEPKDIPDFLYKATMA